MWNILLKGESPSLLPSHSLTSPLYLLSSLCFISSSFSDEEVSLEEKLSKAERDAILQRKRLKKFYEARNTEITRARTAQILFQTEKETQRRLLAQSSGTEGFVDMNKLSESYQRREEYSKRMGNFGLKKPTTRIPSINSTQANKKYQLSVIQDISNQRKTCVLLPPPVSVKKTWELKGKAFKEAKIDQGSARSEVGGR